jgi:hypothetical protein
MAPQSHDFEESASGARGIVMADGRRDLVDGRSRKSNFQARIVQGAEQTFEVWLGPSFGSPPTTVQPRLCAAGNTIVGALKGDMDPKRDLRRIKY